ncbi:MAG: DsbA family protein [Pseudomonadota bacterium]
MTDNSSASIDVYWSFRSPYSYLVTPDLVRLRDEFQVSVQMRIVYPIAIRDPSLVFDNPNKARYIVMDSRRRAEFLDLPFVMPARPDPVVQNQDMSVAQEQPYIHRLSALGVEAQRRHKGLDFVTQVSALIFGGTNGWDQGAHLAEAAQRAGLNLQDMEAAIESGDHLSEIHSNQEALLGVGHWGVPCMVLRDEPFFGQDRIDTLRWRLEKLGLAKKLNRKR